jgi:hypothetical protein
LNLGKFSCLGWSDGGITALIMAGSRPADIEKLVVWGANAFVTQTDIDLYESKYKCTNEFFRMQIKNLEPA